VRGAFAEQGGREPGVRELMRAGVADRQRAPLIGGRWRGMLNGSAGGVGGDGEEIYDENRLGSAGSRILAGAARPANPG
jgi:hypothetical protein